MQTQPINIPEAPSSSPMKIASPPGGSLPGRLSVTSMSPPSSSAMASSPNAQKTPLRVRKGMLPLRILASMSSSVLNDQDSRDDTWTDRQVDSLFENASRLRLLSTSSEDSIDVAEQLELSLRQPPQNPTSLTNPAGSDFHLSAASSPLNSSLAKE